MYILKYWHYKSIVLFSIFKILAKLPSIVSLNIGKLFGILFFILPSKTKDTTLKNLQLCFPDLTEIERYKLARKNFINIGIAIIETSMAWFLPKSKISAKFSIEGLENIESCLAKGKGALLVTSHFTSCELAARFIGTLDNFGILYKPHKKPFFAFIQNKLRKPHFETYITSQKIKNLISALNQNKAIWYAYDIDDRNKRSIFAPFFDIPTKTLTTASTLANMTGASIIPMKYYRNPDNQTYKIIFEKPISNFAEKNQLDAATLLNKLIEKDIRKHPDQYIWQYKRFKSRPHGEKRFYYSSNFPPRWIGESN